MVKRVLLIGLGLWLSAAGALHALTQSTVERSLEQWMTKHFPIVQGRWEAWCLNVTNPKLLSSLTQVDIRGVVGVAKPKKIMTFIVGPKGRTCRVTARLAGFKKVMVAKRILQKAVVPTSDDWQWEERLVDALPRDSLDQACILDGMRTKKVLAKGEVMTAHALEAQPAVLPGQRLTLEVRGQGIVIKTDVTSLEEGVVGDWIKLKDCQNGRQLSGKVVAPYLTQIVLNRR